MHELVLALIISTTTYVAETDGFSIDFPAAPEIVTTEGSSTFIVESGESQNFISVEIHETSSALSKTELRSRASKLAKIISERAVTVGTSNGFEFSVKHKGMNGFLRVLPQPTRVITIQCMGFTNCSKLVSSFTFTR